MQNVSNAKYFEFWTFNVRYDLDVRGCRGGGRGGVFKTDEFAKGCGPKSQFLVKRL